MERDNFENWEIIKESVSELELDPFTFIKYYHDRGEWVAEWIDESDGEEYETSIPVIFNEITINKIPFTYKEFQDFQKRISEDQ